MPNIRFDFERFELLYQPIEILQLVFSVFVISGVFNISKMSRAPVRFFQEWVCFVNFGKFGQFFFGQTLSVGSGFKLEVRAYRLFVFVGQFP